MPIDEVHNMMCCGDRYCEISMILGLSCAPLIKGKAAANVLRTSSEDLSALREILRDTGISCYPLGRKSADGKQIVYLYRAPVLCKLLEQDALWEFLQSYGYMPEMSLPGLLHRLSDRMQSYCEGAEYPHEIGIFLGYPLPDVEGFIEQGGEGCLCTGYWKVYSNETRARELFRSFDALREIVVSELIRGCSIREIARPCTSALAFY